MLDELSQLDPFAFVTQQHAQEAALLWQLWFGAVGRSTASPSTLLPLEQRLSLHIQGLRHKPDLAWAIIERALDRPEGGTQFVATQLAFRSRSAKRKACVMAAAQTSARAFNGFIHGMAALPEIYCYPTITQWIKQQQPFATRAALTVFALRGRNPGALFDNLLHHDHDLLKDSAVRLAAIRCASVTRRVDAKPLFVASLKHGDPVIAFHALAGLLLAKDASRLPALRALAMQSGPCQQQAADLVARQLPSADVRSLITQLVKQQQVLPALAAAAACGDPVFLPWLIELMQFPEWARPAGTAFSTITGLDLVAAGLSSSDPRGAQTAMQNDTNDPSFEPGCPWPDVKALQAMRKAGKFAHLLSGERYLAGQLLADGSLASILQMGNQAQRRGAALEHALRYPAEAIPCTQSFVSRLS